ncbi:hypothetical protein AVEN_233683-1 [Araneus ventricosus]|uniref:Uncharacterized protein n=1 Tax=Araneus ventricosus TaxID=182803 RepID=A0A4Y2Q273_ARAVE|nr:hypothetical protein AVEN_233683-1 [Araneus ventricosus]
MKFIHVFSADCNCPQSQECFLNDQGWADCQCPEGKIEKDDNGEKSCLDCNCHASQECFLNDLGFPDCRCPDGQIENEAYGFKFCLDCHCQSTQECFVNERGLADCRCAFGKIEKYVNSVKTCIDCDCGDGICILDASNIKKCHCGSKQVKGTDGKCYDCDCGVGICNLNESNVKNCQCGSGQAKGTNGKCYECDCGMYGLCEFDTSGKKCTCAPSTIELDGKCIECGCGPHGLCSLESGRKKCVCSPYSVEIDGKCIDVTSYSNGEYTATWFIFIGNGSFFLWVVSQEEQLNNTLIAKKGQSNQDQSWGNSEMGASVRSIRVDQCMRFQPRSVRRLGPIAITGTSHPSRRSVHATFGWGAGMAILRPREAGTLDPPVTTLS